MRSNNDTFHVDGGIMLLYKCDSIEDVQDMQVSTQDICVYIDECSSRQCAGNCLSQVMCHFAFSF